MKVFIGLLVAVLALNAVWAIPARSPNDDAEVIGGPRRVNTGSSDESSDTDFRHFKGVIDTGSGYPFLQPNPPSFALNLGFFDSFDDLFRRLRERIWPIGEGDSDSDSTEIGTRFGGGLGAGLGGFDVDSKKANSTSTVKVVDGHKVEINETVYGDGDSRFRIRLVNVRPLESGEEVEETVHTNYATPTSNDANPSTSSPRDKNRESAEDSDERREPLERDNEIRRNDERKSNESNNKENSSLSAAAVAETSEDNSNANLNAAFVTDNSAVGKIEEKASGNGNIEAETNKPTKYEMLEKYEETTAAAATEAIEAETEEAALESTIATIAAEDAVEVGDGNNDNDGDNSSVSDDGGAVQDVSLTIENNEETETNDNFNESSEDANNDDDDEGNGNKNGNDDDEGAVVESIRDMKENAEEQNVSSGLELLNAAEEVESVTSTIETSNAEEIKNDEQENTSQVVGGDVEFGVVAQADIDNDEDDAERPSRANLRQSERENYESSDDDDDGDGERNVEMNEAFNSEWADLTKSSDKNNDLSNDIDIYASVPIDLSNDIAVNDIAAAQADFPINPDSEFIDINGVIRNRASMPKFEKLSMSTGYESELIEPASPGK